MLISNLFERYSPAIQSLPVDKPLTRDQLLVDDFILQREQNIEMYYAPHNEYLNPHARVMIVGITPGFAQMELAFRTARGLLGEGLSTEEICKLVKTAARFAGAMRNNLVSMLDTLQLHNYLQLPNCAALFNGTHELLHTTSIIRYPVFIDQRNYNGHNPALLSTPLLSEFALQSVTRELLHLQRPLIIPLGKTVETVLRIVCAEGVIDPSQCLWGFPHPSGANGHRHKQFAAALDQMQRQIAQFTW